jgi:hypothetical protein
LLSKTSSISELVFLPVIARQLGLISSPLPVIARQLVAEAIQLFTNSLDCFAALAMTEVDVYYVKSFRFWMKNKENLSSGLSRTWRCGEGATQDLTQLFAKYEALV